MSSQPVVENGSRASRTAARLRQAAREAFGELGWQQTRVQDIVERAGVSHGTFYTYYENKAAILADLVRESQAQLAAIAESPWEGDDVRAALVRVIGGLLDTYERDVAVLRSWLEATRDEPEFRSLYVELRTLYLGRVTENLEAVLAAAGRRSPVPIGTLASSLVAMVEHLAYSWLILEEAHERDDVVAAIVLVWGSTLNTLAGFELVKLDG